MTRHWTTPPNTAERLREVNAWMARETQAAVDKLALAMRDCADKARELAEGIRLLPSDPYRPPVIPKGTLYCSDCRSWRATDVMPGIRSADVPPFTICTYCGAWLDVDSSLGAE